MLHKTMKSCFEAKTIFKKKAENPRTLKSTKMEFYKFLFLRFQRNKPVIYFSYFDARMSQKNLQFSKAKTHRKI